MLSCNKVVQQTTCRQHHSMLQATRVGGFIRPGLGLFYASSHGDCHLVPEDASIGLYMDWNGYFSRSTIGHIEISEALLPREGLLRGNALYVEMVWCVEMHDRVKTSLSLSLSFHHPVRAGSTLSGAIRVFDYISCISPAMFRCNERHLCSSLACICCDYHGVGRCIGCFDFGYSLVLENSVSLMIPLP